jgi:hypothetical protein
MVSQTRKCEGRSADAARSRDDWRRTWRTVVAVTLMLAFTGWRAPCGAAAMDEYQAKAAFLYSLLKFVQWPSADGPLMVAVLGDDPFGSRLDEVMKGRSANGREILLKRVRPSDDVSRYHVVFVSASEGPRVADILKRAQRGPVLTVGDTPTFVEDGGMVRFFVDGERMRFQIGAAAVEQARLKVSAQLLSLAAR